MHFLTFLICLLGFAAGFFMMLVGSTADPRYDPKRPWLLMPGLVMMIVFGVLLGGALDALISS